MHSSELLGATDARWALFLHFFVSFCRLWRRHSFPVHTTRPQTCSWRHPPIRLSGNSTLYLRRLLWQSVCIGARFLSSVAVPLRSVAAQQLYIVVVVILSTPRSTKEKRLSMKKRSLIASSWFHFLGKSNNVQLSFRPYRISGQKNYASMYSL